MANFKFGKAGKMQNAYKQLRQGMTKQELLNLLGQPDGQRVRGGIETLKWANSEWKGWARGGTQERKLEIDFENGKVVGWEGDNINMTKW